MSLEQYEAPGEWVMNGACQDVDPDIFFSSPPSEAIAICDGCPVLDLCREWALENYEPNVGVVAGLSPYRRSKIRRWGDLVA